MQLVLALAAALWGLGALRKAPRRQRLVLIALVLGVVILGHLVLPEGHGLRMATGGSVAPWLILLGLGGLVGVYTLGLRWLRQRAAGTAERAPAAGLLSETELERYARHIVLREIGGPGQAKLKRAKVLVIGAGG
ncbi:MAG: molybdopterin biosynthesis protein, partial [Pseudomonadota bacterium]|nr:molybdopterin biosynthesis protein [Pseudomonadota bacterium]